MSKTQIAYTLLVAERRMTLLNDIRYYLEKTIKELAAFDTRVAAEMLEREINVSDKKNRIPLAKLKK
tara:strand:- start:775 stop:975 length:201 start_codon:yes stop_codon:yes gene_type:complete